MAAVISTTCKLCYEEYSTKSVERIPRRLQCEHIFCTECLQKLNNLQGQAIECPSCLTVTITPMKGIDYLPKEYTALGKKEGSKSYEKCMFCIKTTYPPKSATLHCADCEHVYCGSCSDKIHLEVENQDHVIRLANSFDDLRLSRRTTAQSGRSTVQPDEKPTLKRENSASSICSEHQQFLSMFCQKDQVRCCIQCRLSEKHKSHDCDFLQTNEEQEKNTLIDWQFQLEEEIDRHSKLRTSIQRTMELLKKNTATTKENVHRTFWELRSVLDEVEKDLMQGISTFSQNKLNKLRNQCSLMIESANDAKTVSRHCEQSLNMEFFEMLVQKKKMEGKVVQAMQSMRQYEEACENADLFVQFPIHESLLTSLRSCPYLVKAPPPPSKYQCVLTEESNVLLNWKTPKNMKYIYPINLYGIYASVGENESFVLIQKVSKTSCILSTSHPMLLGKHMVQFRVTCINIIGESQPCFPVCIRLIKPRSHLGN